MPPRKDTVLAILQLKQKLSRHRFLMSGNPGVHYCGHREVRAGWRQLYQYPPNSSPEGLEPTCVSDPSPSCLFFANLGLVLQSCSARGNREDLPRSKMLAWKAHPFYISIQRLPVLGISVPESCVDMWYLGLWVGEEEGGKKCPPLLW